MSSRAFVPGQAVDSSIMGRCGFTAVGISFMQGEKALTLP